MSTSSLVRCCVHLLFYSELFIKIPMRERLYFHLISWCGNFVERHGFRYVSKPEITENYGISRSERSAELNHFLQFDYFFKTKSGYY